ncbi:MAG: hypothetical protein ACRERD_16180, partial [Candidatus Binatia bacterium]
SWRLSPVMKDALEEAAHQERASVSTLLERIISGWLTEYRSGKDQEEDAEQQRLQSAATRTFGVIQGGNSQRSEHARRLVRARLARRHGH